MNERIVKLITEADAYAWTVAEKYVACDCCNDGEVNYLWEDAFRFKFAELIVRECAGLIHLECKDFANGNCFHDDALWESVTTEYGKNKERGFDPVGMSIHFDKMLKEHFGVEE